MKFSNQIDRATELKNCDFIKTCLLIMVVLCHSMYFWDSTWFTNIEPVHTSRSIVLISHWFKSFNIYTFMLISGYIFYYIKFELGKYSVYRNFLINKIKRLIVPFYFVVTIWAFPIASLFTKFDHKDFFIDFIVAESPEQLWFLWALFMIFVIFWPISNYIEKHSIIGIAIMLLLWLISFVMPGVFQIPNALRYAMFFFMGFKIRQFGSEYIMRVPPIVYVLIDFILYFVHENMMNPITISDKLIYYLTGLPINIIGALMCFAIMQRIACKSDWSNSKMFALLKKVSMPIFLFHQQVIYFTIVMFNGTIPFVHVFINFTVAIIVSTLISIVFMKFRTTRFLMGTK